ncbi:MAG: 6-phosphogluconolactonase [Labilithrix sp.]|nr:6-phosphogluconolactonase [Labilithrix sp.]
MHYHPCMQARWLLTLAFAPIAVLHACSTEPSAGNGTGNGASGGSPTDGGGTMTDAKARPDGGTDPTSDGGPDVDAATAGELFAFVGGPGGKIRVYLVDAASGAWTFKKDSPAGTNPSFLAFDPARRRVVAVDEVDVNPTVRSFSFDPQTAALTERNTQPSGGAGPTHVSLDPTGAWVFVANYTAGSASVLPIDATGMLGAATDTKSSGAMSHWAGTDPSGAHVFVPALGANVVAQYTFDKGNGTLVANGTAALPASAGPRHLGFHPSEKWAYVVNETAISLTTFDYDKTTGKLTAKQTVSALPPAQSAAGVSGAEIYVHPSGKHVYASTRAYDSIAHFTVNAADGTLTRVANALTGADRPRSFGVDPAGTLLYAANQDAGQVVGFRIDAATGALTSLGKTVDVASPAFVGLARMP